MWVMPDSIAENMRSRQAPRFLPCGDTALCVEFGDSIDRHVSALVLALADRVEAAAIPGIVELVPTFRSLTDPLRSFGAAAGRPEGEAGATAYRTSRPAEGAGRLWRIPACYDESLAPDLAEVASRTGLTPHQVAERHSAVTYHVYMVGFLPGYPYMGDLPAELALPRRENPRTKVPPGSIAIATTLTAVYTLESPGGWHLIGRTPAPCGTCAATGPPCSRPATRCVFQPISSVNTRPCWRRLPPAVPVGSRRAAGSRGPRMKPVLRVVAPGLMTTLQDLGRPGYQRLGIPVSGALDAVSLRAANLLAGNPPGMGALEIAYQGPTLAVEAESVRVAYAGGTAPIDILAGEAASSSERLQSSAERSLAQRPGSAHRRAVRQRSRLSCGRRRLRRRCRRSEASRRLRAPASAAWTGRPLRAGRPPALETRAKPRTARNACCRRSILAPPRTSAWFSDPRTTISADEGKRTLLESVYTVSPASDRMGMRLAGPALEHAKGYNIVSDGIAPGSIQVPGNGLPIVLLADRQTTGGYPKIATVISADMPALGRLTPGAKVAFEAVDIAAAEAAHRQHRADIDAIADQYCGRAAAIDAAKLLESNLVSGMIDAHDWRPESA